ncbi:TIGR03618 family F420-dependent PPOX class oxidoreductase [Actinocorallia libanotica]|uniref:Pyridoxamine 5'-phosphate oxidase N-terminal domain-containing protein n=1 Tax=Actinocorallia libanotica TaxID=46162 RepID=A0ABN1Q356_9ACTN
MTMPPSQQDLWKTVTGNHQGILATLTPDGLPHLSNVHYLADPATRTIRISTTTTRRKGRNLLRDPRAVLHVPGPDFFNFTVVEGTLTLAPATTPGDPATNDLHEIHSAFNGESPRPAFDHKMIRTHRMVVHIKATRLYGLIHNGR